MRGLKISRERFEVVNRDISDGSEPALRFYILVVVSTLIASFGLIANSTAVVIGAMLVAPLMTPIFSISLALVRGDSDLLGRAARAEIVGVSTAVTMTVVLGWLIGDFEITPEMLSRTRPNLFDLFVAILAGFAGAYAMVDEKISPALPGVAIATAIVPPLANSGLCFSLGEVNGGIGSFLLFFANFLSILIVASATFVLCGMAKHYGAQAKRKDFIRRFGLPVIAFVLIAAFLGHSLVTIVRERRRTRSIKTTLIGNLSHIPATTLDKVYHYLEDGKVQVMASIHTPTILKPTQVTTLQEQLSQKIGMPTELIIRCVISNNVSALGSVKNIIAPRLDGTFVRSSENDILNDIAATEQIIREYFSIDEALDLYWVENLPIGQNKVMLAHVIGARQLTREEIEMLEGRIRKATNDDSIELTISNMLKTLRNTEGTIRYGWNLGDNATPENRKRIRQIREQLSDAFAHEEVYELVNVNATVLDDKFHLLLEIVGPDFYPNENIEKLRAQLSQKFSEPITLYSWSRIERVQGPEGVLSMEKLRRYFVTRQKENLSKKIPLILDSSSQ